MKTIFGGFYYHFSNKKVSIFYLLQFYMLHLPLKLLADLWVAVYLPSDRMEGNVHLQGTKKGEKRELKDMLYFAWAYGKG
jgi:hypothetical protein